jgi:hypothetical protein
LSSVRSRRWKKQFLGPLEGTLIHPIAVGHMIRTVDVTLVPVVLFHDVRFHGTVAVIKFPSAGSGDMLVSM